MAGYIVYGGNPLRGEIEVQGSKNSCLPIMAAALLTGDTVVLTGCPDLADTGAMLDILLYLGCVIKRAPGEVSIDTSTASFRPLSGELMGKLRSSSIFMGAMLGRFGKVVLAHPGGCSLGKRPLDFHLRGFEKMGAVCTQDDWEIAVNGENLAGTDIYLPFPSVGATQNLMIAAVTAKGNTVIHGAAREPEVTDLCQFLIACGAKIDGMGTATIVVHGGCELHGVEYNIMVDRIVATTYLAMAAIAGGEITLTNVTPMTMYNILPLFYKMGCEMQLRYDSVGLLSTGQLKGLELLTTAPHPGVPTDIQPLLTAILAVADGSTTVVENIFENRFGYVEELAKMGAQIDLLNDTTAFVKGGSRYSGSTVTAPDLRGGAALCIAAMVCEETTVQDISHILRGYEDLEGVVNSLGGAMKRI